MPLSTTDVETYPKATVSKPFLEREKSKYLSAGAKAAEITETGTTWVLTTVWPD